MTLAMDTTCPGRPPIGLGPVGSAGCTAVGVASGNAITGPRNGAREGVLLKIISWWLTWVFKKYLFIKNTMG